MPQVLKDLLVILALLVLQDHKALLVQPVQKAQRDRKVCLEIQEQPVLPVLPVQPVRLVHREFKAIQEPQVLQVHRDLPEMWVLQALQGR